MRQVYPSETLNGAGKSLALPSVTLRGTRGTAVTIGARQAKSAFPCLGLALALLLGADPVLAQQESVAESLFREARESVKRGDPEQACPKFEESYRLDPSIGTLLNLGLCEQQRGRIATAWTKLRQFADVAPDGDPRLALARQKIAELEQELPKIRILVSQEGRLGTVRLDGVELRSASLGIHLPVDPGEHVILTTWRTGESQETRIRLGASELLDVPISAPEIAVPVKPAAHPRVEQPNPSKSRRVAPSTSSVRQVVARQANAERTVAYAVGAVGAAAVLTSGLFGLLALREKGIVGQHCPDHSCRDQTGLDAVRAGSHDEKLANVAFAAGVLAIGAGVTLWWHSGRSGIALSGGPTISSVSYFGVLP